MPGFLRVALTGHDKGAADIAVFNQTSRGKAFEVNGKFHRTGAAECPGMGITKVDVVHGRLVWIFPLRTRHIKRDW